MKITPEIQRKWDSLKPSNDFIFSKLMRNTEICKGLLEILLELTIDHIEYPEEQKSIDITADAKSVRLDVYVKDVDNTIYNIEMQASPDFSLPKRSRYYQGMIDLNLIEKGEFYDKLNQSYVIFICTFDPFGLNRHRYRFQNICLEDSNLHLDDGTYKYFFNTAGQDPIDPKIKQVLTFLETAMPVPDNPLVEAMAQAFNHIKSNKKWEVEYMNLYLRDKENDLRGFQRGLQQGLQQGVQQGVQQGLQQGVQQGVQQERLRAAKSLVGILPIKVISEKFDIPIEQLKKDIIETK